MARRTALSPLGVLRLEDRANPAGDVIAQLSGGDLALVGDPLGNEIRVVQNAFGDVRVVGQNGTTVNELPAVTFPGVALNKVEANLEAGNDRLALNRLTVASDILVQTGDGAAVVNFTRASLTGSLAVTTKDANDTVTVLDSTVTGDLRADTGKGNDTVTVRRTDIGLVAAVITDEGNDRVNLSELTVGEDLNAETGKGDDLIVLTGVEVTKSIQVITDDGNDRVTATAVSAGIDAVFVGGAGVDTFGDDGVSAGERLEIKGFDRFI